MLSLITSGVTLGWTAGLLPGPLKTYLIQTTLMLGWRRALIIVVSPLIADFPLILLVVFVLAQFPPEFIRAIQLIGGVFVLWLAWGAWKQFRAGTFVKPGEEAPGTSHRKVLGGALLLNVLSPGPYIFWGTVNGPLLVQGLRESIFHGLAFLVAFYGTFLGTMIAQIVIFDRLRRIDPRVTRALLLIIALALVLFGASLIGQGLGIIAS